MISCTLYTPERVNGTCEAFVTPLRRFKEVNRSTPNPVVCEGKFFALDDNDYLIAFDERTGDIIWKSVTGDLRMVLPIVFDDRILVEDLYTNEGVVISIRDGSLLDRLEVIGASAFPSWSLKGNKLFTVTSNRASDIREQLICRQRDKFNIVWSYNDFSFDYYAASDSYVLLNDSYGSVVCLSVDGQELWRLSAIETGLFSSQLEIDNLPDSNGGFHHLNRTIGYPIIYQDRIGVVPMLDNHLVGVDLTIGRILWARKVENTHNWIRQGYWDEVYCLSSDYVEAFSLETGEQTVKVPIDGSYITEVLGVETISFTQFTVSETHIFAASNIMQYFSAINMETGKVDWAFNPDEAISATDQPYVTNGRVYYPCLGKLYIFEGQGGYKQ